MCSAAPPEQDPLEELVLAAFTRAWTDGRLDVADHLLLALEALTADGDRNGHRDRAYLLVAGGTSP